jgi:chemotaxis protein CheD
LNVVIGVGDGQVSADPAAVLVTYALGSCVALAAWDATARVGGMIHILLPESSVEGGTGNHPCKYGDTALPWLLKGLAERGAQRTRLRVALAGGANVVDDKGIFNIGKRNYQAMRRALWKLGMPVQAEDCGGSQSRTVGLEVATGRFWIKTGGGAASDLVPGVGNGLGERSLR